MEKFKADGFLGVSNTSGIELQISKCGDTARVKWCSDDEIPDWQEIEFNEEGEPFINNPFGDKEGVYKLSEFIRVDY